MPFTLAHPAAAVPLARLLKRRGVLSALVIGSIVPDLAFVFRAGVERFETHSVLGLFWFCLPVGLLGYLWFHTLAKRSLVWLMPDAIRCRLSASLAACEGLPDVPFAIVVSSLMLGSVSHLVWDSFTHREGLVVEALEVLRASRLRTWGLNLPLYKLLQYGSSVVGLALLAFWSWQWLRTAQPDLRGSEPRSWPRALGRSTIATVVLASPLISVWLNRGLLFPAGIPILVSRAAAACVASLVAAVVAYSVLWRLLAPMQKRTS